MSESDILTYHNRILRIYHRSRRILVIITGCHISQVSLQVMTYHCYHYRVSPITGILTGSDVSLLSLKGVTYHRYPYRW